MDEGGGAGHSRAPSPSGVVLIDRSVRSAPTGVRDSKLLAPAAGLALVPGSALVHPSGYAVGHASAAEIDQVGIAGRAAFGRSAMLFAALPRTPDLVILDGNHDWLTAPEVGLLSFAAEHPTTPPV